MFRTNIELFRDLGDDQHTHKIIWFKSDDCLFVNMQTRICFVSGLCPTRCFAFFISASIAVLVAREHTALFCFIVR